MDPLTILAVDFATERVAWRERTELSGEASARECRYPGLGEHPESGVQLGLSGPDGTSTWTVYAVVPHDRPCTTEAQAQSELAKAKAAFAAAGLDLTAPPAAVPFADGSGVVQIAGRAMKLASVPDAGEGDPFVEEWRRRMQATEFSRAGGWNNQPALAAVVHAADGAPFLRTYSQYLPAGAGWFRSELGAAVVGPDRTLLALREGTGNMRGGQFRWSFVFARLPPDDVVERGLPRLRMPEGRVYHEVVVQDLDLPRGLAAFKLVAEGADEPVECRYPGLVDRPRAGVLLGVWDLARGSMLHGTEVYVPADAHWQERGCSTQEQAERALAEAKAWAAARGLDLAEGPRQVPLVGSRFGTRHPIDVAGTELRTGTRTLYACDGPCEFRSAWEAADGAVVVVVTGAAGAGVQGWLTPVLRP